MAITIPEPWGQLLSDVRADVGDPLAPFIPPHVTLLPPTDVRASDLEDFVAHLERVAAGHGGFEMVLSGAASFRPISPVVFVQVSEGISSCERLERAIRSGPVRRDLEFNYHPHVTVAHHVADGALDEAAERCEEFRARFVVDRFDLYDQGRDEVWRSVRSFSLTGAER